MRFDLAWPEGQGAPLLVVLVATIAYVAFHYGFAWTVWLPRLDAARGEGANQIRAVHLQRAGGVLCLGLIPLLVSLGTAPDLVAVGLGLASPMGAAVGTAAVLALVLPVVRASGRKPNAWAHYPQIRASRWDRRLYLHNGLGWAAYLLAYEFFFRGFLLFTLAAWLGAWPAIILSTLAYAWAHLPKFAGETIGTIPMGVVFAWLALDTGGIWAPWLVHVVVAITSDVVVTRADPRVEVV